MNQTIPQQRRSADGSPTTPPTNEPLDISFGVEFEFILIERIRDPQDWEKKSIQDKLWHGLSKVGDVLKITWFQCASCDQRFHMPIGV